MAQVMAAVPPVRLRRSSSILGTRSLMRKPSLCVADGNRRCDEILDSQNCGLATRRRMFHKSFYSNVL